MSCKISILKMNSTVSVFHHYGPTPEKNNVKEGRFILSHSMSGFSLWMLTSSFLRLSMVRQSIMEEGHNEGKHPMEARKENKDGKNLGKDLVSKNPFFSMRSILALTIHFPLSGVI